MHDVDYGGYAYGLWTTVVFSILIVLFLTFSFIKPKNKFEWRSMSAFIGFIAALFTEMYGIPLTIYFLSGWLGNTYPVLDPFSHSSGHLFLVFIGISHSVVAMTILHIITNGIIFFGFFMVYKGWKLIYDAKEDQLVTQGIYSYIRHPQYTGLFLVTIGFLIQWPTIITLAMWPILMFTYYRLTKREDIELENKFGKEFLEYKERVPAFIPENIKTNNRKVIL
ncbi:MAG: isoprenylcysteine carboxylmethyltransferase family protein [Ignavibacteriae bacterium]|nr:isoprenylcysteine carboxylmethyltransferase family protein [Ignavibacteriota bacterium]